MDDTRRRMVHPSRCERRTEVTRREFLAAAGVLALAACGGTSEEPEDVGNPKLLARPLPGRPKTLEAGVHRVSPNGSDLVAYVPASALDRDAIPVMVFLHGANRTVESFVEAHRPIADDTGVVVLAPYAAENTWDASYSTFNVDVRRIDDAILPFANARDRIVPSLRSAGYTVDFRPFEGGHAVLLSMVTDNMQALAAL